MQCTRQRNHFMQSISRESLISSRISSIFFGDFLELSYYVFLAFFSKFLIFRTFFDTHFGISRFFEETLYVAKSCVCSTSVLLLDKCDLTDRLSLLTLREKYVTWKFVIFRLRLDSLFTAQYDLADTTWPGFGQRCGDRYGFSSAKTRTTLRSRRTGPRSRPTNRFALLLLSEEVDEIQTSICTNNEIS